MFRNLEKSVKDEINRVIDTIVKVRMNVSAGILVIHLKTLAIT